MEKVTEKDIDNLCGMAEAGLSDGCLMFNGEHDKNEEKIEELRKQLKEMVKSK